MGTAHVATVHWFPVTVDRKLFGFGVYPLPAVPFGKRPEVIEVRDMVQYDYGPYMESSDKRRRPKKAFPETGQVIALDIVKHCTERGYGMVRGCHPGIWVVRESMPLLHETDVYIDGRVHFKAGDQQIDAEGSALWRPATPKEAQTMWDEDEAYAREADAAYAMALIEIANGIDEKSWSKIIFPITKSAAKHYTITTPWNTKAGVLERMPCMHCGEPIIKTAVRCRFCTGIIDPIKAAYNEEKLQNVFLKQQQQQKHQPAA